MTQSECKKRWLRLASELRQLESHCVGCFVALQQTDRMHNELLASTSRPQNLPGLLRSDATRGEELELKTQVINALSRGRT